MERLLSRKFKHPKIVPKKGKCETAPAAKPFDEHEKGSGQLVQPSGKRGFHFKRQPDNYPEWEGKLSEGTLDVPKLQLCEVPIAIFDYRPPIKIIYMKDNYIRQLPQNFFDELPSLAWLDLRNNKLRSLPELKVPHFQLRVVLLQDNELQTLPFSLCQALKLKNLSVTGNSLVDPPEDVRENGCAAILSYLKSRMLSRAPVSSESEEDEIDSLVFSDINTTPESDAQLVKDLEETVLKLARRDRSSNRLSRQSSQSKTNSNTSIPEDREAKRIERLKYTWGLWKNVVYDGPSAKKIFEDQYAMVQNELLAKTATQRNAILQRIKNQETLSKWRRETMTMKYENQHTGGANYQGLEIPFGTDEDLIPPPHPSISLRVLNEKDFEEELTLCYDKLHEFASNPVSLTNVNQAMKRLEEVENVQQKLLGLRLSVKSALPN